MTEKFEVSVIPADIVYEKIGGFDIGGLHLYRVRSAEGNRPAKWLEVDGFRFTPRKLEILYLRSVESMNNQDVGKRLGITEQNAKNMMLFFRNLNSIKVAW